MAEECSDRVQAHAAVDGLGGQGVAELVSGDVADPCLAADPVQCGGDPQRGDGPVPFQQQPVGAQPGGPMLGDPVVEHFLELGMQWDVAVVVELADRDSQPEGGSDLDDGVDGEGEQFALADSGAGEQFDDQPGQRVGVGSGGSHQLGRGGVVEEPWQGLVDDG